LKSKEPKQPKEKKKSEAKPRKSSEKSTRVPVQAVADPHITALAHTSARAASGNGAADPPAVAIEFEMIAQGGEPTEEMIRVRAYELYVRRGYEHGHHLDDWLAAERELKSR